MIFNKTKILSQLLMLVVAVALEERLLLQE
jgi:hypothetical protein